LRGRSRHPGRGGKRRSEVAYRCDRNRQSRSRHDEVTSGCGGGSGEFADEAVVAERIFDFYQCRGDFDLPEAIDLSIQVPATEFLIDLGSEPSNGEAVSLEWSCQFSLEV
jgi:hypothetical protein